MDGEIYLIIGGVEARDLEKFSDEEMFPPSAKISDGAEIESAGTWAGCGPENVPGFGTDFVLNFASNVSVGLVSSWLYNWLKNQSTSASEGIYVNIEGEVVNINKQDIQLRLEEVIEEKEEK